MECEFQVDKFILHFLIKYFLCDKPNVIIAQNVGAFQNSPPPPTFQKSSTVCVWILNGVAQLVKSTTWKFLGLDVDLKYIFVDLSAFDSNGGP